jgi:hypothetical protein
MSQIDFSKIQCGDHIQPDIVTVGGSKVRIYSIKDEYGYYSIHGSVEWVSGWSPQSWMANGKSSSDSLPSSNDLVLRENSKTKDSSKVDSTKIDISKIQCGSHIQPEIMTVGKNRVRIYSVNDDYGYYPIHGSVEWMRGWFPQHWTKDGRTTLDNICNSNDLVLKKKAFRVENYFSIYKDLSSGRLFVSSNGFYTNCVMVANKKVVVEGQEGDTE